MSYTPTIDYQLPIEIERLRYIRSSYEFLLELGGSLPELGMGYHTYGKLNAFGDNVIWVCHPMIMHSGIRDSWPNMIGPGLAFDTDKYYVVCANIFGSCFGSIGARSLNPITGRAYGLEFPAITIRDQVKMHGILAKRLGVKKIKLCVGAVDGGFQALEFGLLFPKLIEQLLIISSAAQQTKKFLGIHTLQRAALETDEDFGSQPSLIIGVENDPFIPFSAQQFLAQHIAKSNFEIMPSITGHFGFLNESEKISALIKKHRLL